MGWGLVGGSQVTGEGATEADMGTLALSSVSLLPSDHEGNRCPLHALLPCTVPSQVQINRAED
jgi:hypothetical protein